MQIDAKTEDGVVLNLPDPYVGGLSSLLVPLEPMFPCRAGQAGNSSLRAR